MSSVNNFDILVRDGLVSLRAAPPPEEPPRRDPPVVVSCPLGVRHDVTEFEEYHMSDVERRERVAELKSAADTLRAAMVIYSELRRPAGGGSIFLSRRSSEAVAEALRSAHLTCLEALASLPWVPDRRAASN